MLEVFEVFPWRMKDEDSEEFDLITDIQGNSYFDIHGEKRENPIYDPNYKVFINEKYIVSAENGMVFDNEMTGYPFCEIKMINGAVYFLPMFWEKRYGMSHYRAIKAERGWGEEEA